MSIPIVSSLRSNDSPILNHTLKTNLENRILEIIERLKITTLNRSQNLRITCPITHQIMEDPCMLNCRHVYERVAIESHHFCITCNSKIDGITPDHETLQLINVMKQDFVPNLEHFQASRPKTALLHLALARSFMDQKNYTQALSYFNKAFSHTNSTALYSEIPTIYDDLLGDPDKALIARLYLSLYQLREGSLLKAIVTLSCYTSTTPCIKTVTIALSVLANPVPASINNAKKYAFSLKETNPQESSWVYKQLVTLNSEDFEKPIST